MRTRTHDMTVVSFFCVLLVISSKLALPVGLVPVTLQTAASQLIGLLLGYRQSTRVHALFLIMGLVGLPVFSSGGGPLYALHPTFGYLPGLLLGAALIGWSTDRIDPARDALKRWQAAVISLAGLLLVYACGVSYLFFIRNVLVRGSLTWFAAIQLGVLPFIAVDAVLSVVVAFFSPALRRLTRSWLDRSQAAGVRFLLDKHGPGPKPQ